MRKLCVGTIPTMNRFCFSENVRQNKIRKIFIRSPAAVWHQITIIQPHALYKTLDDEVPAPAQAAAASTYFLFFNIFYKTTLLFSPHPVSDHVLVFNNSQILLQTTSQNLAWTSGRKKIYFYFFFCALVEILFSLAVWSLKRINVENPCKPVPLPDHSSPRLIPLMLNLFLLHAKLFIIQSLRQVFSVYESLCPLLVTENRTESSMSAGSATEYMNVVQVWVVFFIIMTFLSAASEHICIQLLFILIINCLFYKSARTKRKREESWRSTWRITGLEPAVFAKLLPGFTPKKRHWELWINNWQHNWSF